MDDVAAWMAADVDEDCRQELQDLVDRAVLDSTAMEELSDRFAGVLQFGTAGLRGEMAAGPNRMNRAVVMRAARGLIDYLNTRVSVPIIVIGNDARRHSRRFALDTAAVVAAAGGRALLLPDRVPTPVLAYAVRRLDADAGVMVTASHNPAADNGYKVYLGGRIMPEPERGAQIVPPYDTEIAAAIAVAPAARSIPLSQGWEELGNEVVESYLAAVSQGASGRNDSCGTQAQHDFAAPCGTHERQENPSPGALADCPQSKIRIVHTAMHGVGSAVVLDALMRAGFHDVCPVEEQREPDPDFSTVSFPNPEEAGAIDLALALAAQVEADVVIANDPDADRCAVAVNDPRSGWRMLHGDELGSVLGEHAAQRVEADRLASEEKTTQAGEEGRNGQTAHEEGVVVNSIVSSRQLGVIALSHGVRYVRTLTGFKWMGRVPRLGYAYEEAIGYCVRPDLVHDKDGISAAVEVARLVAFLKADGKTMIDVLDDLARRHGLYLSSQLSVRFDDGSRIADVMARLRQGPPETLASSPVASVIDLSLGYGDLPPTDGIMLLTGDDDRVIVRPSGTEPKVKCYLEVIRPVAKDASFDDLTQIRSVAASRLQAIKHDLRRSVFD